MEMDEIAHENRSNLVAQKAMNASESPSKPFCPVH